MMAYDLVFFLENPFFLIIIGIIFVGVIINLISSGIKKGGEVVVKEGSSFISKFFTFLKKIVLNLFKLINIIFLTIILIVTYFLKKK